MKIYKIYDSDCDICQKMARFDHDVILRMQVQPVYRTIDLGHLIDPGNPHFEDALVAQYVERYACNPDYTVDLPVYMVLEGKKYLGHLSGELTADELREGLEETINEANSQSRSAGPAV